MKASEYRQRLEADAGAVVAAEAAPVAATAQTSERHDAEAWSQSIGRLRDASASTTERIGALKTLQAATFLGDAFDRFRADYLRALRGILEEGDEPELRRRALDVLASMKDDFARERIVAGLQGQEPPLVPPAVALGLLARDDHASTTAIAHGFLARAVDRFTRAQAVRLLSRDATATALFERLMVDKDEFREVRQASAAALRHLDPQAFVEKAQQIVTDRSDFDDIRKTARHGLLRAGVPFTEPPERSRLGNLLSRVLNGLRGRGARADSR